MGRNIVNSSHIFCKVISFFFKKKHDELGQIIPLVNKTANVCLKENYNVFCEYACTAKNGSKVTTV